MLKIVNLCVTNPSKDKFLFLKRNKSPFRDYWGMLGGKVEEDEKENDAAVRELFEESGINANGNFLGLCHEKIVENDSVIGEFDIYFFHFIVDEKTEFNSSHEGEIKWISFDEFSQEKLIPSDPLMIKSFLLDNNSQEAESVIEKKGEEYFQEEFVASENSNIINKVKGYVREVCDGLEHGDEWFNNHFSGVVKYSKILAEKRNSDMEISEIAAWFHDVGGITRGREDHHITGSEIAEKKLKEFGYPEDKIEKVKHCILSHRGSRNIKRETAEAQILADADSMSHFDELGGLFKYEFIIGGINFKQKEAQRRVKEKLIRSYNKLSSDAKNIIKPKFEAAMLLLEENNNININTTKKVGVGVGVMILKEGKVLLGKRHIDNSVSNSILGGGGSWTFPGGKLEYGESFEEAGIRETHEECGIDLKNIRVICVNNDGNEKAQFVTIGLFSDEFTGETWVMEPDKITEWKWFNIENLPEKIYFPSRKMIENYKLNKFYIKEEKNENN